MSTYVQEDSLERVHLKTNHNFAMRTDLGWLFARVLINEMVEYEYDGWDSVAEDAGIAFATQSVTVGGQSYKLLYHEFKEQIWEIFPSWNNPDIKVFWRFPATQPHFSMRTEIGWPDVTASTVSDFGWLMKGSDNLISNPTGKGRFLLPPYTDVQLGLWNESVRRLQPVTVFHVNKLLCHYLNPTKSEEAYLIAGILKQKIPALLWTPGVDAFPYPKFKDYFEVEPVFYDGVNAKVGSETGPALEGW